MGTSVIDQVSKHKKETANDLRQTQAIRHQTPVGLKEAIPPRSLPQKAIEINLPATRRTLAEFDEYEVCSPFGRAVVFLSIAGFGLIGFLGNDFPSVFGLFWAGICFACAWELGTKPCLVRVGHTWAEFESL